MAQTREAATKQVLEGELTALEQQIELRKATLAAIKTDIKSVTMKRNHANRKLAAVQQLYDRQEQDYLKREKELKTDLERLAATHAQTSKTESADKERLTAELEDLRQAVAATNRELKERQAYLKEQEAIIQSTLDDGSARIADLDYQVKQVLGQHQTALLEKSRIDSSLGAVEAEIEALFAKRNSLEQAYTEAAQRYKADLTDLKLQAATAKSDKESMVAITKVTLERLRAKEQELESREAVLADREQENERQRRFLASRGHLAPKPNTE